MKKKRSKITVQENKSDDNILTLDKTVQANYEYFMCIEEMLGEVKRKNDDIIKVLGADEVLGDEEIINCYQKLHYCSEALPKIIDEIKEIIKTLDKEEIYTVCDLIG